MAEPKPMEEKKLKLKDLDLEDKKTSANYIEHLSIPKTIQQYQDHTSLFWSKEPVGKLDHVDNEMRVIEKNLKIIPPQIPSVLYLTQIDLKSDQELANLEKFMDEHGMVDMAGITKIFYPKSLIRWYLSQNQSFNCCLKVRESNKIAGFIAGVKRSVNIGQKTVEMGEIVFLCVHKKYHGKKLTPMLFQTIKQKFAEINVFCGIGGTERFIYQPLTEYRLYSRPLNVDKLLKLKLVPTPAKKDFDKFYQYLTINKTRLVKGMRPMKLEDVDQVCELFAQQKKKYHVTCNWTQETIKNTFLNNSVIHSFVVEIPEEDLLTVDPDEIRDQITQSLTHKTPDIHKIDLEPEEKKIILKQEVKKELKIADFVSYYTTHSRIINNSEYEYLNEAYLYYCCLNETVIGKLLNDLVADAAENKNDVFSVFDTMNLDRYLDENEYYPSQNNFYLYAYNYQTPIFKTEQVNFLTLT